MRKFDGRDPKVKPKIEPTQEELDRKKKRELEKLGITQAQIDKTQKELDEIERKYWQEKAETEDDYLYIFNTIP